MNMPRGISHLDACIDFVRRTEPPSLSEVDARRMVRKAQLASARRPRARVTGWRWSVALAAASLIAIALKTSPDKRLDLPWSRGRQTSSKIPLTMRLPSNDVLIAASNSKFHITSNAADNRQIALRQGAMLFEVEPLKSGQRFEVYTPHARAAVRGTIFSVDVTDLRTVFRVYEGVIQVAQRHAIRVINVNEAFATDGAPVRTAEDASLLSEAMRAVRLRENVRQNQLALQRLPEQRTPHNAATSVTEPANTNSDRGRAQTDIRINDIKNPIAQPVYQTPIEAQRRLYQGQAGLALLMARNARATRADVGDWKLVEADALRALGRFEEAADAYWQASRLLHPQGRAQAGYLAAQLYYRDLRRPDRALAILDAAQVDARKSPLRERALLLRAQSMERLGQRPAEIARRYLADYPNSAAADIMRVYLENRDSTRVFQGR